MAAYTTIDDPEAYFQTVLYTGNGSDDRDITLPGTTDMQPDFVWIKERSSTSGHQLTDSARGVGKHLNSNDVAVEGSNAERVQAFNSDGFQIGTDSSVNQDTITHVAWCWNTQGGAGSSNTDGGINTTTTSVGATQGFSMSTYSGTGSASTIGHGLGAAPGLIFLKRRTSSAAGWAVYHHANTAAPETDVMYLNTYSGTADDSTIFNDTAPTSTVFSIGTDGAVNGSGDTYMSYAWAEKQGYSKFGTYVGNGNNDGSFVYLGFRPAFLMTKSHVDAGDNNWHMMDNKRNGFNLENHLIQADLAVAEETGSGYQWIDFLSNGFKAINSVGSTNSNGATYLYIAFAEAPFVSSNGIPGNAR